MTFLNEPGSMLYTYSYHSAGFKSDSTNAAVLVMADGTMWRARFEPIDIKMDYYVHGIQLCHIDDFEETMEYANEWTHTQYYKSNGWLD